jgi:hypothetical protein
MANRRMINSDLFEDEFFGSLDMVGRLLWIGLLTACADDQGRLLANASVIRAKVYPFDDVGLGVIQGVLERFSQAGKVTLYEADGKRLCQVVNWWRYQTPAWAAASKYPAPEGWVDRVKAHVNGNKITMLNWDKVGGYAAATQVLCSGLHSVLCSGVDSGLHRAINEDEDDNDNEIKGEEEVEVEGLEVPENFVQEPVKVASATSSSAAPPAGKGFTSGSAVADRVLFLGTGMSAMPPSWNGHRAMIDDALRSISEREGQERAVEMVKEVYGEWTRRGYRPTNPGWVDWLIGGIPAARGSPGKGGEMSARDKIKARAAGGQHGERR